MMDRLVEAVKTAALEVMHNAQPVEINFGTVIKDEPLEIEVEQKIPISGDMIILTSNVVDREVVVEVNDRTEDANGPDRHNHKYEGDKIHIHKNKLKKGEKVILLRLQGGQRYIVWDRVMNL